MARREHLLAAAAVLVSALAALPARAEFEIQESTIDPQEIQIQYRGAWHSGLPKGMTTVDADVLPDDEEAPLRQSHELEFQFSFTDHWLVAWTNGFDQPDQDNFRLSSLEFETQVELITREGDGLGFAIQGGTEQPVFEARDQEAPDLHFGPIVELAKGKFVLTTNPLFFKEQGHLAEQEGLGFEYGWQARYEATKRLSWALEMFGEIDDMDNAGPFNNQVHSIGPAFYYTFGEEGGEDDDGGGDEPAGFGHGELTVSLGGQFGLTDATSDFAVKVFIGYEFISPVLKRLSGR
jgi:hypothetical protein